MKLPQTFFWAFLLLACACRKEGISDKGGATKADCRRGAGDEVPDSLFPLRNVSSSADPRIVALIGRIAADTDAGGAFRERFPKKMTPLIAGPLSRLLGCDSAYVEEGARIVPLSRDARNPKMLKDIYHLSGDDLSALVLVVKSGPGTQAIFLSGGIEAGPAYECDSMYILQPKVVSVVAADSIVQRIVVSAYYENGGGRVKNDSGEVVLRIRDGGIDTLRRRGTVSARQFAVQKLGMDLDK
jgi:hypothetical protein